LAGIQIRDPKYLISPKPIVRSSPTCIYSFIIYTNLRILILSPAHPLRGGIAASSERLAHELQAMGHTVVMYSFSLQYPSFLFPGKTQYTDQAAPSGLTIKTTINSINPFSWLRTATQMRKEQPDLVITRYWLPFMAPALGTILCLLKWFGNKHVQRVGLVDNLIPHEKRFGDRLLSRYFAAHTDRFLAMSASVATDIHAMTPNKSVIVSPHPIYDHYGDSVARDHAVQHLGLSKEPKHLIMFFGFIRAYKGLDLLLAAMADQRIRRLSVQLLIAGECYEDWATYQAMIDQYGIGDRVVLHTDYIADTEVRYYFSAADLIVQPYKTATQSGITQIAMHFNKPTLVTRVGGLPEMVQHGLTGFVVEPEPEAIAEAIVQYLTEAKPEVMASSIETAKAKYAWRLLAQRLVSGV
jgi:D-inositol-3-phosphate glycosyltransferase